MAKTNRVKHHIALLVVTSLLVIALSVVFVSARSLEKPTEEFSPADVLYSRIGGDQTGFVRWKFPVKPGEDLNNDGIPENSGDETIMVVSARSGPWTDYQIKQKMEQEGLSPDKAAREVAIENWGGMPIYQDGEYVGDTPPVLTREQNIAMYALEKRDEDEDKEFMREQAVAAGQCSSSDSSGICEGATGSDYLGIYADIVAETVLLPGTVVLAKEQGLYGMLGPELASKYQLEKADTADWVIAGGLDAVSSAAGVTTLAKAGAGFADDAVKGGAKITESAIEEGLDYGYSSMSNVRKGLAELREIARIRGIVPTVISKGGSKVLVTGSKLAFKAGKKYVSKAASGALIDLKHEGEGYFITNENGNIERVSQREFNKRERAEYELKIRQKEYEENTPLSIQLAHKMDSTLLDEAEKSPSERSYTQRELVNMKAESIMLRSQIDTLSADEYEQIEKMAARELALKGMVSPYVLQEDLMSKAEEKVISGEKPSNSLIMAATYQDKGTPPTTQDLQDTQRKLYAKQVMDEESYDAVYGSSSENALYNVWKTDPSSFEKVFPEEAKKMPYVQRNREEFEQQLYEYEELGLAPEVSRTDEYYHDLDPTMLKNLESTQEPVPTQTAKPSLSSPYSDEDLANWDPSMDRTDWSEEIELTYDEETPAWDDSEPKRSVWNDDKVHKIVQDEIEPSSYTDWYSEESSGPSSIFDNDYYSTDTIVAVENSRIPKMSTARAITAKMPTAKSKDFVKKGNKYEVSYGKGSARVTFVVTNQGVYDKTTGQPVSNSEIRSMAKDAKNGVSRNPTKPLPEDPEESAEVERKADGVEGAKKFTADASIGGVCTI